jgi:hypothetical protein
MLTSLVATLLLSQSLPLTTSAIAGRVVAGVPPHGVASAVVRSGAASATTGADGGFTLIVTAPAPPATTVRITVTAGGFLDASVDVTPGAGALTIVLQPSEQVREQVTVSASASDQAVAPPTLVVAPAAVTAVAGALDNVFRVLSTLPA